ncbi:hypothetical protein [Actinoplanes utahensis]|uniref:Uncharacterized protein n=1 Tax=Actinoplanes utahensis TaxID=1869 RepID=A0A0A6XFP0_ACTUT|nr:hypothetical protein [Actinoplanes utahensis]KHD78902.1 hypothetical protein MB27_02020 [Actinoplanes utahensis]GIF28143.1 hypothetical protein Aut01nite_11290 [Actinoplanes utahensis]
MRDQAVIFIPPTIERDGLYAQECMSYVVGRGYKLCAIFGDWNDVDLFLGRNGARVVVVVARAEHRSDRPAEIAGERTQVIKRRSAAVGRCTVPTYCTDAPDPGTRLAAYREGYADGYVDCLTIRGTDEPPLPPVDPNLN